MGARFIIGDVFDGLASLPDNSVDLILSSPPFLGLRSYLPADHPTKAKEIGSEDTPADFLDTLLDVVEACDRVLAPHGSLVFELGDTYCADTETEILTRDGWKHWDELVVGDDTLTVNPSSGLAEWQMVDAVNVFSARPRRMLSVEGRSMSALVTDNHRWLVQQRRGGSRSRWADRQFRSSTDLTLDSTVPTAAPIINLPAEPKWSDALVEAVAWYWTEGHDRQPSAGRTQVTGIYIAQSHRVNPVNVGRIRACLTELFGAPSERLPGVKNAPPKWRVDVWPSNPDKTEFRLNAAAALVLRECAPGKVPKAAWLSSLTQAQLDLFIERSIDADGQRTSRGVGLAQKDRARASAFQMACLLAGRSASLNVRRSTCVMHAVTINAGLGRKPLRQAKVEWVMHNGIVWCPTTANGTWLARRRGTAYFTGNSGSGDAGGGPGWPLPKSLTGIPTLFAWSLAYGRNLLRPERTTEPWRIRNLMPWQRANPSVGSLGDKWRPATSYVIVATKSSTRYFDLDSVRTPSNCHRPNLVGKGARPGRTPPGQKPHSFDRTTNPAGAPPLDWWIDVTDALRGYFGTLGTNESPSPTAATKALQEAGCLDLGDALLVNTKGYRGVHYATFPLALILPLIQTMCPERVCTTCGAPSRRITRTVNAIGKAMGRRSWGHDPASIGAGHSGAITEKISSAPTAKVETIGWTHCACGDGCSQTRWETVVIEGVEGKTTEGRWVNMDEWVSDMMPVETRTKRNRKRVVLRVGECRDPSHWRLGVTLDPFVGSGTTLEVATGLGRDAVGLDIDARNADLARERVGMFLEVDEVTMRSVYDDEGWTIEDFLDKMGCEGGVVDMLEWGAPGCFPPEVREDAQTIDDCLGRMESFFDSRG